MTTEPAPASLDSGDGPDPIDQAILDEAEAQRRYFQPQIDALRAENERLRAEAERDRRQITELEALAVRLSEQVNEQARMKDAERARVADVLALCDEADEGPLTLVPRRGLVDAGDYCTGRKTTSGLHRHPAASPDPEKGQQ